MESSESPRVKRRSIIDRYFAYIARRKASDALLLKSVLIVCVIFLTLTLIQASMNATVHIATFGGTLTEGIVGTPRFVNPVLAVTRADKDLTTLIYDGIMSLGADGSLEPNIAESVTVSEDGLTYNIILRKDVTFHDDAPLTARDVVFTVSRIQDPILGSPLRANFDGVIVEEVGEFELNFVLSEAYAPFIENLTFGILPEHIWKDAGPEEFPFSQHNSEPLGSGSYKIAEIIRNASGIPERYILKPHEGYHRGSPKIATLELRFYPTEERLLEAWRKGSVDSFVGVSPEKIPTVESVEPYHLERIPLPRTFAVFINQNKSPALRDASAREALNRAIDKTALVETVLHGYGNPIASPVPPGFNIPTDEVVPGDMDAARDILRAGGWKMNSETQIWEKTIDTVTTPLSFSITTVNNSAFEATAEALRATWETLGAQVTVKQFEQSDLTQSVIRPRDYEALLFGTQLGRPLDFYSFWHSSQRNDPGLNVALYANITTDSILSEVRRSTTLDDKADAITRFAAEIMKETPALFLYAPELLYVFPDQVGGAQFNGVGEPHERFARIHEWYVETESVWPFFTE